MGEMKRKVKLTIDTSEATAKSCPSGLAMALASSPQGLKPVKDDVDGFPQSPVQTRRSLSFEQRHRFSGRRLLHEENEGNQIGFLNCMNCRSIYAAPSAFDKFCSGECYITKMAQLRLQQLKQRQLETQQRHHSG